MQATTTKHHGNLSILDRIVVAKRGPAYRGGQVNRVRGNDDRRG